MSWVAVARKDFRDAVRSRVLWAMAGLVALVGVLVVWVFSSLPGLEPVVRRMGLSRALTLALVAVLSGWVTNGVGPMPVLVPLVGLLVGYKSVVGERESGRIKILLGLPHTRRDVVVGKFVGRAGVVVAAVGIGLVLTALTTLVDLGVLAPGVYAGFLAVTLLFAVVHVGIGVGISAVSSTDTRAVALLVGFVFVFQVLWGALTTVVANELFGRSPEPDWYGLVRHGSPGEAYGKALDAVVGLSDLQRSARAAAAGGSEPFYLADWFGFVVLAVWTVVPLAVGYLRFRSVDLL